MTMYPHVKQEVLGKMLPSKFNSDMKHFKPFIVWFFL